jgi:hypothetical protein
VERLFKRGKTHVIGADTKETMMMDFSHILSFINLLEEEVA